MGARHAAVVGCVTEVVDGARRPRRPSSPPRRRWRRWRGGVHAAEVGRRRRAELGGIAVGEDLAVGEQDPVALPVGGRARPRSPCRWARGAEVGGVTEGVDVARSR